MTELQANFNLEPQQPINASFELGDQTPIEAMLSLNVINFDHNQLTNRDLPNQHPIEAITNLREILNKMWTFTFEQGEPSETWVIQHNLGRNPSVIIVDSAGSVQIPDQITYDNENKITIQFIGAFAGKAFLN